MESYFTLSLNTGLTFDGEIDEPITNAASILRRDMEKIFELRSIQHSRIRITRPDALIPGESWIIEVTPDEMLVRYGDSLGCVYALLFISGQFLGVTPFWFWNDQRFTKRASIPVPPGVWRSPPYAVRFRGWFVNDEVLIDNWREEPEKTKIWVMVFEALLRCGGNMTIAGTDGNGKKYRALAAGMGLWNTHHHAEPLGAGIFARVYPDQTPSYAVNGHLFERLWEQAVLEEREYKIIWSLGFRGQGDRPFWADDPRYTTGEQRGRLISDVINRQYNLVKRYVDNPVCCINLYGEITVLYRQGLLKLPPGIIKIWADNGYGRMVSRRQGNSNPRVFSLPSGDDRGPHGIYYHCSFHDLQASNHLTMSPNTTEFLAAELEKSLEAGAGAYWIINCGSVKPHVHALDFVKEMWQKGTVEVSSWRTGYAKTYFGGKNAENIAALFGAYAACTAKYGPAEDDRAGEQIWHHPVRELLCRWMAGLTADCVETLIWFTGDAPFSEQVYKMENLCRETLPRWKRFHKRCTVLIPELDADSRRLFSDSILLQTRLQLHGAAGALAFCESFRAYASGNTALAFRLAERSHSHYERSGRALLQAEHDKWKGYYNGDCLTDVRLTALCLDALVSYLRVVGDGPDFHKWERDFLTPAAERNVMLLSSKQRALTNENLAKSLALNSVRAREIPAS
jgi:hypothetical protein